MPYVACPSCAVRSYLAPRVLREPCPVCGADLRAAGTAACPPHRPATGEAGSDADLADRHRRGDAVAFATLHDRYALGLRAHAGRLVGWSHADDVVQEAFERAHRFVMTDARAGDRELSLGAWLHTVVHRRCVDERRRAGRIVSVTEIDVIAAGPTPHQRVVVSEQLAQIGRAVRALPARQREALVRHALDGESHAQLAGRLDVSVAATKSLVNRARHELRHSVVA